MTKESRVSRDFLRDIVDDWVESHSWDAEDGISDLVSSSNAYFDEINIEHVIIGDERNGQFEFSFNGSLQGHHLDNDAMWSGDTIHFSADGIIVYDTKIKTWKVSFGSVTSSGLVDALDVELGIDGRADIYLMDGRYRRASESVEDLIAEISEFSSEYWWRGHRNQNWRLKPGIARYSRDSTSLETELRLKFENQSMFIASPSNQLGIAKINFLMQHHGLPTRLLDWSTSPLVALYFSAIDTSNRKNNENKEDETDGCLWVLDPRRLNNSNGTSFPYVSGDEAGVLFTEKHDKIYAIHAPYVDLRMKMQQSEFTVHGHNGALEREYGMNHFLVRKIIVKHELKERIRERLNIFGITRAALFADMDNIAKSIKKDVLE